MTLSVVIAGIISPIHSFPNNMIAYYPLNGNGYDLSDHGNNGTIYNATSVPGMHGSALYFNGYSSYVSIPDNSSFTFTNGLSISAWIRPEAKDMWYRIVSKEAITTTTIPQNEWQLGMSMAGGLYFGVEQGSDQFYINGSGQIALNTWIHVTGTWDGSTMRIYLNGILQSEIVHATPPINRSTNNVYIGMSGDSRYYFKGIIDELMIFNRGLTPAEVDSIYNGSYYPGQVSPYPVLIPYIPNPTFNRRPQLCWHSNSSISTFRVQVSPNQSFSSLTISVPISDTFFVPTANLPIGVNYWRVRNDADSFSCSSVSSFTIQDSTIPILVPYMPDPTRNRKPVFAWHRVPGATSYNIQIGTYPSFYSNFLSDGIADTIYPVAFSLPVGTIYWHVNSNLNPVFSSPDTLTILNDSIPWLIPMVSDTQYNRMPIFKWHPATAAIQYRIQIDTVGNFYNPYISLPIQAPDTVYVPTVKLPLGRIFWRVGGSIANCYSSNDTFWVGLQQSTNVSATSSSMQFNAMTIRSNGKGFSITYSVKKSPDFSVKIFSLAGVCIKSLHQNNIGSENQALFWDGTDKEGRMVPNGNYLVVCKSEEQTIARKIALMR